MFLVTGCGRSGTRWAARLLTRLGHDCGHERWHTCEPFTGMHSPDSSWLAIPNLGALPEMPVVHLVRDPLQVVRSLLRIRFLADGRHTANPYAVYVARHRPDITAHPDHLGRVIAYVARWDEPVTQVPNVRLRVEDATPERVADVVAHATGNRPPVSRVAEALDAVGDRVNSRQRRAAIARDVTWETVAAHPLGPELIARADAYGYERGAPC